MKKISKKTSRVKAHDFTAGRRGAVLASPGKTRITIYVDTDVLEAFRDTAEREGRGYQTAMNQALRSAIARDQVPVEERVRVVVREELAKLKAS